VSGRLEQIPFSLAGQLEDLTRNSDELGVGDVGHLSFEAVAVDVFEVDQFGQDPVKFAAYREKPGQGVRFLMDGRVGHPRLAIERGSRKLLLDGESLEPEKPDEKPTVGKFLVLGDETGAAHLEDGRR